jgi:hypothetical protein
VGIGIAGEGIIDKKSNLVDSLRPVEGGSGNRRVRMLIVGGVVGGPEGGAVGGAAAGVSADAWS